LLYVTIILCRTRVPKILERRWPLEYVTAPGRRFLSRSRHVNTPVHCPVVYTRAKSFFMQWIGQYVVEHNRIFDCFKRIMRTVLWFSVRRLPFKSSFNNSRVWKSKEKKPLNIGLFYAPMFSTNIILYSKFRCFQCCKRTGTELDRHAHALLQINSNVRFSNTLPLSTPNI